MRRAKVDEEIQNLQIDRMDKRGKTTEQMKKHSLETNIESKPVDKALFLLSKGDDLQKLSVIENLPHLMQIDSNAAFNKVIPRIQQELSRSSSEFSITTSRIFQVLIETHLRNDVNITHVVLQGLDSKDPLVASAWLETLIEVILFLPIRIIQQEVIPVAVQKGQCSQPTNSRVCSCRIIGKIVIHPQMKSIEIKKDILPLVYSLCQDVNYTVRAAICEQIPAISKGLGTIMVKNFLLANLIELSSDDNANVRAVAVSSVVQVLSYLDRETKVTTMIPLIMNLFTSHTKIEDASAVVLAKNMGLLLTSLENCLTIQQADNLINFYQQLAKRGLDTKDLTVYNVDTTYDVKGREYCAGNFPAVMSFTISMSPANVNKLYDIFKSLTFDSCYMVRLTIAGIFHDVAKILGPKNSLMKTEYVRLLRDEAEEVLSNLVPHISTTLILFLNNGTLNPERTDNISSEISKALLKCYSQLFKSYNWRLTTLFLKQLEALPMVFKSDQIHNEFTPQIVRCTLYGRSKPVKSQAVRTLLFFLRWNTKLIQKTWLRDHLIHELAENRCCYKRHIFIELCKHAIELFSSRFFKENFLTPLLRLTSDKVSTIRWATVNLLPKVRKMLQLPQDRKLLTTFEQVIIQLEKNEKDRDVLSNLVTKTKEMMSPAYNVASEEMDSREKKLIEEEENVAKGKITFNIAATYAMITNKVKVESSPTRPNITTRQSRSQSVHREPLKSTSSASAGTSIIGGSRSTSAPRPSPSSTPIKDISDMTFLKQHFYIDAGVDLPIEENNSIKNTNCTSTLSKSVEISDNFSNLSIDNNEYSVDNCILNMTDDVKVNMRRKKSDKSKRLSHSEIPTAIVSNSNIKNKRHSSICTDSSLNNNLTAKRRSLNIQTKELSKIPVILKNSAEVKDKKNSSNLPIRIRSTTGSRI